MPASVLADFVGTINAETADWDPHPEGRVLLNDAQLVLAASDDDTVTVRLATIFDVNVGTAPRIFEPHPGTPVTIAYEEAGQRHVAMVAGEESTIEKFAAVLFKAILNGTGVTVKHPARIGGRVGDADFRSGRLALDGNAVAFQLPGETATIDLPAVTDFDRTTRTVDGHDRPVLEVRHMQDGQAMTTVAAAETARKLSILGRYLRRKYDALMESLAGVSLAEPETETLVTLYSTGDMDVSPSSVLDADEREVKQLLKQLYGKGLVEIEDDRPTLTTSGQVVVNHHLERVNG